MAAASVLPYSAYRSLSFQKMSSPQCNRTAVAPEVEPSLHFKAIANFSPTSQFRHGTLELRQGDEVEVVDRQASGWWCVVLKGNAGWVPSTYLEPCSDEVEVYMMTTMPLPLPRQPIQSGGKPRLSSLDTPLSTSPPIDKAQPFMDGEDGYITLRLKRRSNRPDVRHLANESSRGDGTAGKPNDNSSVYEDCVIVAPLPPRDPVPAVPPREKWTKSPPVPQPRKTTSPNRPRANRRFQSDSALITLSEQEPPALPPRRSPRPLIKAQTRDVLISSPQRKRPLGKIVSDGNLLLRMKGVDGSDGNSPSPNALRRRPAFALRQRPISEDDEAFEEGSSPECGSPVSPRSPGSSNEHPSRCSSGISEDQEVVFDKERRAKSLPIQLEKTRNACFQEMKRAECLATLGSKAWFHGRISRQKAEERLNSDEAEMGSFLVRESESQPDNYSMSVKGIRPAEVLHYQIKVIDNGHMFSMEKNMFCTIDEIVSYYQKRAIFEIDGKRVKLGQSCRKRRSSRET
eukprot:m.10036 g.10036  ORF g.10036 m.10036 type:complete len:515 (+) comp21853_c0_seq2:273-1817(+)